MQVMAYVQTSLTEEVVLQEFNVFAKEVVEEVEDSLVKKVQEAVVANFEAKEVGEVEEEDYQEQSLILSGEVEEEEELVS